MDIRLQQLQQWVEQTAAEQGIESLSGELLPVSGDASFRRYFRAVGEHASWIAVDAPPDKENSRPFVDLARDWFARGVRVPEILAADLELGFMLLEDFGDRLLLPELKDETAQRHYSQALSTLLQIQQLPADNLAPYDEALLQREMGLFDEWYTGSLLSLTLDEDEVALLAQVKSWLVDRALSQRQVTVHRDYHSRNLMLLDDGGLGVIDFQDAVRGAQTYDLVSLFRDSYIRWSDAQVAQWVEEYRAALSDAGVSVPSAEAFLKDFDCMGMQRQLKVLGIFSRLYLRDGKDGYLPDMPRTLGYLVRAAARYPETEPFARWLERRVVPAMSAHPLFEAGELARELG
ncbi:aminoglycoside phosphotransferase family protein [Marinobacterium sp. YM272]|uniref:aminoglycoside phosphotransferase family protein n=1 Tax=Marinobacterium sp. YM272 TaxID=3421654 RepID=UPI003D7F6856